MIVGNTFAKTVLERFLTYIFSSSYNSGAFILLVGPKHIGKTTLAQHLAQTFLGSYYMQDFLFVRDLSDILSKTHFIKVGTDATIEMVTGKDDVSYPDFSVRYMNYRLQQSAVNGKKILLIENIERMTTSAANAFLKSSEELLSNRVILATSTTTTVLTPTLVSRAFVLHFYPLSDEEMDEFLAISNITLPSGSLGRFYMDMAMGRPGILYKFASLDEKAHDIFYILSTRWHQSTIHEKYVLLRSIHHLGLLDIFLDAWIAKHAHDVSGSVFDWLAIKNALTTNVSLDRTLLYAALI